MVLSFVGPCLAHSVSEQDLEDGAEDQTLPAPFGLNPLPLEALSAPWRSRTWQQEGVVEKVAGPGTI